MLIHIIFGMLVGAFLVLHYLTTNNNKKSEDTDGYKFYLNVIIQNKSQVVKKRVSEKVPHGIFGFGRKIAANVADSLVTDERFAKKVGTSLKNEIPKKLAEKFGSGINVKTKLVFLKDNLAIVSIRITKANIVKIIGMQPNGGKEKSSKIQKIFDLLGKVSNNLETQINKKIAEKIGAKMRVLMQDEIKTKLKNEGGVDVLIKSMHSSDQADFFYSLINETKKEKQGGYRC